MEIITTNISGIIILEPRIWGDDRGYFFESYSKKTLSEHGIDIDFVQDNEAMSSKGVLRGLHYQIGESAQTKLVRVSQGEVLDIAVDIRPDSDTYGQHVSVILNDINRKQMLVPKGFAHGYIVLSDIAVFQYKCDNFYDKESEGGIHFGDPKLHINWILDRSQMTISEKDNLQPVFGEHKPYV